MDDHRNVADPRVRELAELLVGRSLAVEPGWQVLVQATALARPMVEELVRGIARRGAYPLVRLSFTDLERVPFETVWAEEAPEELLEVPAPSDVRMRQDVDARVIVFSAENVFAGSELPAERRLALRRAARAAIDPARELEKPWVSCPFPTQGLAQEAGVSLRTYADILYAACLRDWDAEGERMRRYAGRFDGAEQVRIVGPDTDLTLSLAGRQADVDDGHVNMPGGEFFFSPVEDSAEGLITFGEYAATFLGRRCEGIRLRFEGGRVVDASARSGEDYLVSVLDTDDGARRLGELGIGCNPGIPRHVQHMWWDEKIDGTIHLALGQAFTHIGGLNESAVHWDIVKDLSQGSIALDGETVQRDGEWLI
jgi:aminopeptidase